MRHDVIGGSRHGGASLPLEALFRDAAQFVVSAAIAHAIEQYDQPTFMRAGIDDTGPSPGRPS